MQSPARAHAFQAKGKPRARMLLMETRRAETLQRQQSGRQSKVQTVRDILESACAHADDSNAGPTAVAAAESTFAAAAAAASSAAATAAASTAAPSGFRPESAAHRSLRAHWAHQLMMPEPLEHLPSDAVSRWMLLSRPEGLRCLVVSRRGRTLSRKKNGSMLHAKFASSLPHGGAGPVSSAAGQSVAVAGASAAEDASPSTILDCVWNAPSGSYLILDALVWNNHHLADTEAEFRLYWLWNKLQEMGATLSSVTSSGSGGGGGGAQTTGGQSGEVTLRYLTLPASAHSPYAFHLLEPVSCSAPLLSALYPLDPRLSRLGARQDGYLFLHRATLYEFGLSQLSLQWKDRACCTYLIEDANNGGGGNNATAAATAAAAAPSALTGAAGKQMLTLRLGQGRALQTEDGETVGSLDELTYQMSSLRAGDLLQCSIDGIDESDAYEHAPPTDAAASSTGPAASATGGGGMIDESKEAPCGAEGDAAAAESSLSLVNLTFVKKASAARMQADSLSKILFQFHARHDKLLSIQQITQQLQQQQQQQQHMQTQQQHAPTQQRSTLQSSAAAIPISSVSASSLSASSSLAHPAPSSSMLAVAPTAASADVEGDTHME